MKTEDSSEVLKPGSCQAKLMTGIGPVTSALPMRRTTDCATSALLSFQKLKMQKMGVEPTRVLAHTDLNRARLPFRHFCELGYDSMEKKCCQWLLLTDRDLSALLAGLRKAEPIPRLRLPKDPPEKLLCDSLPRGEDGDPRRVCIEIFPGDLSQGAP